MSRLHRLSLVDSIPIWLSPVILAESKSIIRHKETLNAICGLDGKKSKPSPLPAGVPNWMPRYPNSFVLSVCFCLKTRPH